MNIFYSWQSDLPSATNREFIEDALERAVRSIRADDSIQVEPRIDRDAQDIVGSPDISGTILEKIDKASIFVCDVSIINRDADDPRKMPNPNVLFELGYAIKTMGSSRVILVQNIAFGGPDLLPFDLKMKRVLSYDLAPQNEKAQARAELQVALEQVIRMIIPQVEQENQNQKSVDREILVKQWQKLLGDPNSRAQLADLLQTTTDEVWETLQAASLFDYKTAVTQEEFLRRVEAVETLMQPLAEIFAESYRWGQDEQARPFVQALRKLTRMLLLSTILDDAEMQEVFHRLEHMYYIIDAELAYQDISERLLQHMLSLYDQPNRTSKSGSIPNPKGFGIKDPDAIYKPLPP